MRTKYVIIATSGYAGTLTKGLDLTPEIREWLRRFLEDHILGRNA